MTPKRCILELLTSFAWTISSNKEVSSRAMKAWTVKLKPAAKIYGATDQFCQEETPQGHMILEGFDLT